MKKAGVLIFAIFGLLISSAYGDEPKSYRIALSDIRIGTTEIGAGEYKILVHRDEPKVQFIEVKTGNVVDVAATVESADAKFDRTEVHSQNVDGAQQLKEIRIRGTNFRIDFQKSS